MYLVLGDDLLSHPEDCLLAGGEDEQGRPRCLPSLGGAQRGREGSGQCFLRTTRVVQSRNIDTDPDPAFSVVQPHNIDGDPDPGVVFFKP